MRYALFLAVCPLLSGCLGFAYPALSQVPAVAVTEPDVAAFHVSERSGQYGSVPPTGSTVTEAAVPANGAIAARRFCHFEYKFVAYPILLGFNNAHHDSVRLYRPGYETVVIEGRRTLLPWWQNEPQRVTWRKAETLEAREKAIRDLHVAVTYAFGQGISNAFVAQEYAKLAASELVAGPAYATERQRLTDMANAARTGTLPVRFEPR